VVQTSRAGGQVTYRLLATLDRFPPKSRKRPEAAAVVFHELTQVDRQGREVLGRHRQGGPCGCLTGAIRSPKEGEPRRPAKIEVRQGAFEAAWKAKLKQIDVECVLCEALDAVDLIVQRVAVAQATTAEGPAATATSPEELITLPSRADEVWQADVRPMPAWIMGQGQPYRPWVALVVSKTEDLVLAYRMTPERPPADWLQEAVFEAVRRPMTGNAHRPGVIEVGSAEQQEALLSRLHRAGIACVASDRLDHLESVLDGMAEYFGGQGALPSLMDAPGMKLSQLASFYAAAADYYRAKPWQHVPGDTPIKVECDKFQSGPWYAVVMGQSGVQQGLAVYEDLAALQGVIAGGRSDEENARQMSAVSMMFSEAFEISTRDLDAAEQHGWAVAGPEAYPLVLHINPGGAIRVPLTWELELLEACLRTIPQFVRGRNSSLSKTVAVASGEVAVRITAIVPS
jgi:hypothetical protein